jgi:hypothetical protein
MINTASGRVSMRCWNCRFRSTVRKQSKSAAAFCKSWPFLIPDQPISATVRTACAVNSVRSRFGTHSSSNTRMRERQIPCLLKRCDGKFTCNAGEILQKFIERIAALEIVQQRLKRHASSGKAWGASHNLRITRNSCVHEQIRYRGSTDAANSRRKRDVAPSEGVASPFPTESIAKSVRTPSRPPPILKSFSSYRSFNGVFPAARLAHPFTRAVGPSKHHHQGGSA